MPSLLLNAELVSEVRVVLLSWLQGCISPSLYALGNLGRRIRILLALEAYAYVLWILDAMLAGNACALEVTSVNLNTWLVGEYLEQDAALWRIEASAYCLVIALAILICIQTPVVVVTSSVLDLVEAVIHLLANLCRSAEIHWSFLYTLDFTCWNVQAISWCELICIDVHHLVETFLRRIAIQIEVAMVGHVDNSFLICCCTKFDIECIITLHCIFSSSCHITRETILAILCLDSEGYRRIILL